MLALTFLSVVCVLGWSAAAPWPSPRPAEGDCLCIDGSDVNIRGSPCGSVIGQSDTGSCFTAKGGTSTCDLSGTSYTFWEFEFNGGSGWAAHDYLTEESASRCEPSPQECPGIYVVSREEWGARPPGGVSQISGKTTRYFVHHATGPSCYDGNTCEGRVRSIQSQHMDNNGWNDIGYSFLVGEDGRAYQGRGWGVVGAHTQGYNSVGHGICVIGNYMDAPPNNAALNVIQTLIQCGIDLGHAESSYSLHGHRDAGATLCPGDKLYDIIEGWPQFEGPI